MIEKIKSRYLLLIQFLIGILVFAPFSDGQFLAWDDELHISKNPLLKSINLETFIQIWSHAYQHLYIPISYSAWGLIAHMNELLISHDWQNQNIIWPFAITSYALHFINTILAFKILNTIFDSTEKKAIYFGVAIFFLHPIQVETVVWLSAFRDILGATFTLLTLLLYIKKKYKWTYLTLILAVLSKPNALMLPCLILTLEVIKNFMSQVKFNWKDYCYSISLALISLPFAVLTKHFQADRFVKEIPSTLDRALVAADSIGFYILKILWPLSLGPNYGRTPNSTLIRMPTAEFIVAATFFLVIILFIKLKKSTRCAIATGIAFFLIPLLPVLGFIPFMFQNFSSVADRYIYVSMLAVSILGVMLIRNFKKSSLISVVLISAMCGLSFKQTMYWKDEELFYTNALKVNPRDAASAANLGYFLANKGRTKEALASFERALSLKPDSFSAASNIGTILMDLGEYEMAANHYASHLENYPKNVEARIGYGILLSKINNLNAAKTNLKLATELDPSNSFAFYNYSLVLLKLDLIDESLTQLKKAINLDPYEKSYQLQLQAMQYHLKPASKLNK